MRGNSNAIANRRNLPASVLYGNLCAVLVLTAIAQAGGPKYVAGTTYFDPGTAGVPLTWSQGIVNYYTDQGNLSPILLGPGADAVVADAFSQWTSIPTAAMSAVHAGQLAEDVTGTDIAVNGDNAITSPLDITPAATAKPVGIVYDVDGSVTDALLGQGAGSASSCFTNAAFGGLDNFGAEAHFLHALIVLNGNCAQESAQVPDLEYRLVRVLGRVLGLDWSQLNLNVVTGTPRPTADDYNGFPVMHDVDSSRCVPISLCYSNGGQTNPYQPKMDDQASLARLYPVTSQNVGNFTGKQISSQSTTRIHGNVYFADANGQPAQGMQGINVVARWVDPSNGVPSRSYAAASVSGFLFTGNAGNTITGFSDSAGQQFSQYGATDSTLEGFFDLSGLQLPNGETTGQYQLSVEALDPLWSENAGPYEPLQVQPSGTFPPVLVNVALGGDIQQDILMQGSAVNNPAWFEPTTYASPAPLPEGGDWIASLGVYGVADYFWFNAQNNRTLSVIVTALDESSAISEGKAQPVAGIWALADPGLSPAPAETPSAFNTTFFGETRLDATLLQSTAFRLGIADYRGDGRPDYRYHARVFYGDNIFPARASVAGSTPIAVQGLGFLGNTTVTVGTANPPTLAVSAKDLLVNAPPMPDGIQNIALSDSSTGATSLMTGVLTYGAGPSDTIALLSGPNPSTPVGGQIANPIRVIVLAADGHTPVPGASVYFTSSPAAAFSVCGEGPSCTVVSDQSGQASTGVTVLTTGIITITAQLAPASYTNPKQVQTTVFGASGLGISLSETNVWIAEGATLSFPIIARVISSGSPVRGEIVDFTVRQSGATLTAVTDANGYAAINLPITSFAAEVDVNACIAGAQLTCPTFSAFLVPLSSLELQAVSGITQVMAVGSGFTPVTVRVTDQATPPDPVLGAGVIFQTLIGRSPGGEPVLWIEQTGITQPTVPVILAESQAASVSDVNGLATIQPTVGGIEGPLLILGSASVGNKTLDFALQSLLPPAP